jgi:hypothetical protein
MVYGLLIQSHEICQHKHEFVLRAGYKWLRKQETLDGTPVCTDFFNKHIVHFLTYHFGNNFLEEKCCVVIPFYYKNVMKIINKCLTILVI